ncbi:conserved hypothetical protein [Talaromyces stipitatus ATCC 10500]|uniref:CCZ1/INTU/HSP4 first Longin domain-containing protein n=1 Tax=Talaromyces stipitatus (strain ATCC 10500 / CBS 375.48 / QM 6759 / NRRL 1006) TaxID=441959 RepID=B8LTZ8_TALSN|nr:uncharacterized protein TSTA_072210 [Talaromyces stipitatus ATCC 10500]EED23829.1 conserved hypothetical protein [Talaromyces stipitatus ATCC 10500]
MNDNETLSVIPAQLGFLTIYNPSLGTTDETLQDQIVFYYSAASRSSNGGNASSNDSSSEQHNNKDETNERLRKIGLAQGMVNFAKNFSNGRPVDSVETEKSRIVLDELESDWWILASIDFTRISSPSAANASSETSTSIEYSSREIYPPQSLIQQLRRAHSIFLLHHSDSLESLYGRVGREPFCKLLGRFWNRFVRHWLVLLNGNPAVDLFNGVKLAVGGELGIGVGEEEWGSGEREVLEDFVSRTNGLVDLVVSRFGDAPTQPPTSPVKGTSGKEQAELRVWLGSDQTPRPSDGVIFSGVGAISRRSLVRISHWMEWIYRYGEAAYGVDENPSSGRSRRRRRPKPKATTTLTPTQPTGPKKTNSKTESQSGRKSPGIPLPLVVGTPPPVQNTTSGDQTPEDSGISAEMVMKYLTLGYGSVWKIPGISPNASSEATGSAKGGTENGGSQDNKPKKNDGDASQGKFIIGLRDDLEEEVSDDDNPDESVFFLPQNQEDNNRRTLLRTVQVEAVESASYNNGQVLTVQRQPFMFTFLFDLRTPSLTLPSFYRSIHHQLGPLQRPLLSSTSPLNVARRIYFADCDAGEKKRASSAISSPIHDLVYDPSNLTVRSSIPNIPEPGVNHTSSSPSSLLGSSDRQPQWSRLEALNVHSQFLSTYIETRSRPLEMERTCKTSRGWWLIWVRIRDEPSASKQLPPPQQQQQQGQATAADRIQQHLNPSKEAFLIRKASDALSSSSGGSGARHSHESSSGIRFLRDLSGASSSGAAATGGGGNDVSLGSGKLTEGLGFDAHRYIESLLSLNR